MHNERTLIVAAIDFGTTYSGYAYSMRHEYEKDKLKISANNWMSGSRGLGSIRTSTAVLLNQRREFDSFGFEAEEKYLDLAEDDKHNDWYYFKGFKMMLHEKFREVYETKRSKEDSKKNKIYRNIMLKDITDEKEMPVVDIFAMAIRYMKNHLLTEVNGLFSGIQKKYITWVLTVSAIWSDVGKQFMREAAEDAGIDKERLLIALEPEAASVYCKHVLKEEKKFGGVTGCDAFTPGSKYLLLDAGGGTVDVTVYEVLGNEHLREIHKGSGGPWGGEQVDESFRQMLVKIFGGPVFTSFCAKSVCDYKDLLRDFEVKKRTFKEGTTGKVVLYIPLHLRQQFKEDTEENIEEVIEQTNYSGKVSFRVDKMRIDADVFKNVFEDACRDIVDHLREVLTTKEVKDTKTILMAGEFSESPFLQSRIKREFPDMTVISPPDAGLAVLKGAVLFGYDPITIEEKIEEKIPRIKHGIATIVRV